MALKPTIYKFSISLSDLERNRYDELNLTVAQHPSETAERMLTRVLVYCLTANDELEFTRGLSDNDEPDLWRHSLDGRILEWFEIGEPTADRLKKASRLADSVSVYSFNTKSDVWWTQTGLEIEKLGVMVVQFPWEAIHTLAGLLERTMQMSVTVTEESAYVATERGEIEISWRTLSGD